MIVASILAFVRRVGPVLRAMIAPAGWVTVVGLLVLATLWSSEPGGADPPASSWRAGRTIATWDWERHWNYWNKWVCKRRGYVPGRPEVTCLEWLGVGAVWKPCGPRISPPDPNRTNTCNIGRAGGHDPHGDDLNEKYTYLGRHEDRTGPPYPLCADDPSLPADTSPGNCGTWTTVPHRHCPGDRNAHPPDCASSTTGGPSTTAAPSTTATPPTTAAPPTTRPPTTEPPVQPDACYEPEVLDAFFAVMDTRPEPGLGLRPSAHGYVRVPMQVAYTHSPRASFSRRVGRARVYVRMWVGQVSWSFTDLGTLDGVDLGRRTFHRRAPEYRTAWSLRSPARVSIGGREAVYRRSSLRSGYAAGHPVILTVIWEAQCRQSGVRGWVDLIAEIRRYRHVYKVYAIRSRPG